MLKKYNRDNVHQNGMRKKYSTQIKKRPVKMFSEGPAVPPRQGYVPNKKKIYMRYDDLYSSGVVVTSTCVLQEWNANSTFDPDRTGVGHQPYGRDNTVLSYNRYRVTRLLWEFSFPNLGEAYNYVICPYNGSYSSTGFLSSLQLLSENPRAVSGMVGTYGNNVIVKGSVWLYVVNGVSRASYLDDDRFQATAGASPTEIITLACLIYNPNGSSIAVTYNARLTYVVEWTDPLNSGLSLTLSQLKMRVCEADLMHNYRLVRAIVGFNKTRRAPLPELLKLMPLLTLPVPPTYLLSEIVDSRLLLHLETLESFSEWMKLDHSSF